MPPRLGGCLGDGDSVGHRQPAQAVRTPRVILVLTPTPLTGDLSPNQVKAVPLPALPCSIPPDLPQYV